MFDKYFGDVKVRQQVLISDTASFTFCTVMWFNISHKFSRPLVLARMAILLTVGSFPLPSPELIANLSSDQTDPVEREVPYCHHVVVSVKLVEEGRSSWEGVKDDTREDRRKGQQGFYTINVLIKS